MLSLNGFPNLLAIQIGLQFINSSHVSLFKLGTICYLPHCNVECMQYNRIVSVDNNNCQKVIIFCLFKQDICPLTSGCSICPNRNNSFDLVIAFLPGLD